MDVIDIPKMKAAFRVLYDVKGRFVFLKLKQKEANFKLCRIQKKTIGSNKVCYLVTHDGRTLRYSDPEIEENDSVQLNLKTGEIDSFYKMKVNNLVYVYNGNNRGRVGIVSSITKFAGNHDLITVKDTEGHIFTTRVNYVFVIGKGNKSVITLPKEKGIRSTIIEEQKRRNEQN